MPRQREPLKRHTPMKRRSDRMQRLYNGDDTNEGRIALVKRMLERRPICEAGAVIGKHTGNTKRVFLGATRFGEFEVLVWRNCKRTAQHVHEVLSRSAGGSITDENNCMPVCFNCHWWINNHPRAARAIGISRSRYNR